MFPPFLFLKGCPPRIWNDLPAADMDTRERREREREKREQIHMQNEKKVMDMEIQFTFILPLHIFSKEIEKEEK